jgi:hypothetical protein
MAQFLTTRKAAAELEDLALRARARLVLITPYVKLPRSLEERFRAAARRKVEIVVVCRGDDLRAEQREKLLELDGLRLRFMEHLHAKCYCNEDHMVISSLNLHEFSEQNNREMGILLSRDGDPDVFAEAMREVNEIIDDSVEYKPTGRNGAVKRRGSGQDERAHCIRCSDELAYRPDKPLCRDCYPSWAAWGNVDYEERFCHRCGDPHRTSMDKPLCSTCYRATSARKPARL